MPKKNRVLTFWSFDILHPWHEFYLKEAKKLWKKLITIIARDSVIEKVKNKKPVFSEEVRLNNLKKLNISDLVELWHETDYYACIFRHKPDIICLWYDQNSFDSKLKDFLKKNFPNTEIFRITSHFPEKFKSSILRKKLEIK